MTLAEQLEQIRAEARSIGTKILDAAIATLIQITRRH